MFYLKHVFICISKSITKYALHIIVPSFIMIYLFCWVLSFIEIFLILFIVLSILPFHILVDRYFVQEMNLYGKGI